MLNIQVVRDGEPRSLRWGWFHYASIVRALRAEGRSLNDYGYRFSAEHTFVDSEDGEVFVLAAGDEIRAWR